MTKIERVKALMNRITLNFMGIRFSIIVRHDMIADDPSKFNPMHEPRVFIQIAYDAPDTKNGEVQSWKSRKWYLSEFMTDDEIVKSAYLMFRTCIEHEVLEGFKVDGTVLFNPHVNFEELLEISHREVTRNNPT